MPTLCYSVLLVALPNTEEIFHNLSGNIPPIITSDFLLKNDSAPQRDLVGVTLVRLISEVLC
jgi:hypothetical protein